MLKQLKWQIERANAEAFEENEKKKQVDRSKKRGESPFYNLKKGFGFPRPFSVVFHLLLNKFLLLPPALAEYYAVHREFSRSHDEEEDCYAQVY